MLLQIRRLPRLAFTILAFLLFLSANPAHGDVYIRKAYRSVFQFLPQYAIPSEASPELRGLVMPVFDAKPYDTVNCKVVVAPDGSVAAVIHDDSFEAEMLADTLKDTLFSQATVDGALAWGYERFGCDCFFYTNGGDFSELPVCRFRLDSTTLNACFVAAKQATKYPTTTPISIKMEVDAEGNVSSMTPADERGAAICEKVLGQPSVAIRFAPAKKDGKAVASSLTLQLYHRENPKGIAFTTNPATDTDWSLPSPYAGAEAATIQSYLTYNEDGSVRTISLPGTLDRAKALAIFKILEKQTCTLKFSGDDILKIVGYRLRLTPGSTGIEILQGPYIVPIQYPDNPDAMKIPFVNLPLNRLMNADLSWRVTKNGIVTNKRIDNATPPVFGNHVRSMMKGYKKAHGSFDGKPAEFIVFAPLKYVITDGGWNFD